MSGPGWVGARPPPGQQAESQMIDVEWIIVRDLCEATGEVGRGEVGVVVEVEAGAGQTANPNHRGDLAPGQLAERKRGHVGQLARGGLTALCTVARVLAAVVGKVMHEAPRAHVAVRLTGEPGKD